MLGAILGDIIGSTYEHHNRKSKSIELFTKWSRFTDDSVMTIAVAEAFLSAKADGLRRPPRDAASWARRPRRR
ncbi:MAG: ADP-ribosylglycohydrolase family protein, partial [Bacillota bacterium]